MLLRFGAAVPLLYFGITGLAASDPLLRLMLCLVEIVGGLLLLAGLWTPVAGFAVAIGEVWKTFSSRPPQQVDPWVAIVLALLSAGVALLGPGAWSVDARIFGRRRLVMEGRTRQS